MKTLMGKASTMESEAFDSIINNLSTLAQELKNKDPTESQVIETIGVIQTIRANMLRLLGSL